MPWQAPSNFFLTHGSNPHHPETNLWYVSPSISISEPGWKTLECKVCLLTLYFPTLHLSLSTCVLFIHLFLIVITWTHACCLCASLNRISHTSSCQVMAVVSCRSDWQSTETPKMPLRFAALRLSGSSSSRNQAQLLTHTYTHSHTWAQRAIISPAVYFKRACSPRKNTHTII